jgi:hypothetical protein
MLTTFRFTYDLSTDFRTLHGHFLLAPLPGFLMGTSDLPSSKQSHETKFVRQAVVRAEPGEGQSYTMETYMMARSFNLGPGCSSVEVYLSFMHKVLGSILGTKK